ncbi:MAG: phosphate acyltransferase PlsX [Mycoplasma sp.]|nr:phosphate acyltransferase PlsX [Mycoplasma sp.]
MKTIAFDVMGNDNGVKAAVEAAIKFTKKNIEYKIILVGDRDKISLHTKETEKLEIIDVKETVDIEKGALSSRSAKTSMAVAVSLVKSGRAHAVLSSGSSSALLTIVSLELKRLNNVRRAAFMPIFPTIEKNKKFVMLDVGANLQVTSENIVQWANIGSIFSHIVNKKENPTVGIVNIGTEDKKGLDFHKEANEILKQQSSINYIGFIEPRKLLEGIVDVAVIDGYGGNLVLKTLEGTMLTLFKTIKKEYNRNLFSKIAGLLSKKVFTNIKENFDYRNVGAAWIVGVNGLAIKAHGSSDLKSYLGALNQAKLGIDNNILVEFEKAILR